MDAFFDAIMRETSGAAHYQPRRALRRGPVRTAAAR
jgi:hypothetical protein